MNMRKLLIIVLSLVWVTSFAQQQTDATLETLSIQVRDETRPGYNTANRIGSYLKYLNDSKISNNDYITASGTDTYTAGIPSYISSYVNGQIFLLVFTNANTGSATLNLTPSGGSALGAKSITSDGTTALTANTIKAGQAFFVRYNGLNFQLIGGAGSGGGGGGGTTTNPLTVDNNTIQLSSGTTFNGSTAQTISVKPPQGTYLAGSTNSLNRVDASSALTLPNGNILVATSGFPGAVSDASPAKIYTMVSTDGGKTFSAPILAVDFIGGKGVFIPSLDIRSDNSVYMLVLVQTTTSTNAVWKIESNDGGITFGGTQTMIYNGGGSEYYSPAADRIFKTSTGRRLYPLAKCTSSPDFSSQTGTYIGETLYSDNEGSTWTIAGTSGSNIITSPDGLCVEGGIYKEYNENFFDAPEALIYYYRNRSQVVYCGRSTDNGLTWYAPSGGTAVGLKAQNSTTTIKYEPNTRTYYAAHNMYVGGSHGYRNTLLLSTSKDALTWSSKVVIDENFTDTGIGIIEPTLFFNSGIVYCLYTKFTSAAATQLDLWKWSGLASYIQPVGIDQFNNILVKRNFSVGSGPYFRIENDGVSSTNFYHELFPYSGNGTVGGTWQRDRSYNTSNGYSWSIVNPANVQGLEIDFSTDGSTTALTNSLFKIRNGAFNLSGGTIALDVYPKSLQIPNLTTATRPSTSATGQLESVIAYNTTTHNVENYNGTSWLQLMAVPSGNYTTGAIPYASSANVITMLAPGSDTQVLTLSGGVPTWATAASGGMSNPMTTLGDIIYENATPTAARLAGNTTTTNKFLTQVGNGSISSAPGWNTIQSADVSPVARVLTGTNTFSGAVTDVLTSSNTQTFKIDNLLTTKVGAVYIRNTTAADNINIQQNSPALVIGGSAWKTNATAASQTVDFYQYVSTAQGSAAPTGTWNLMYSINGAAPTNIFSIRAVDGQATLGQSGQVTQLVIAGTGALSGIFTPGLAPGSATNTIGVSTFGGSLSATFDLSTSSVPTFTIGTTSGTSLGFIGVRQNNATSSKPLFATQTGALTSLTNSVELCDILFDFSTNTKQWSTGLLSLQRDFRVVAREHQFVGASTETAGATLALSGPPKMGTNATGTTVSALLIEAGSAVNAGSAGTAYGALINAPTGATNNYALGIIGNVNLTTAGNKIFITEGSNGSVGQTTLVSGTKAVTVTGTTTSTRCFATLVSQGGTVTTTIAYGCACTANTVTITALDATKATVTTDTSIVNYWIVN